MYKDTIKHMRNAELIEEFFTLGVVLANRQPKGTHRKMLEHLVDECKERGMIEAEDAYKLYGRLSGETPEEWWA